jgi:hypothetical protein
MNARPDWRSFDSDLYAVRVRKFYNHRAVDEVDPGIKSGQNHDNF